MLNFNQAFRSNTFFASGSIKELKSIATKYDKVLIMYGGMSLKANGAYDKIISQLKDKEVYEYPGISANPKLSDVRKAIEMVKEHKIDVIIAAGGGSVVDAAKAVAVGAKTDADIWEAFAGNIKIEDATDIISIITNVATGSETNDVAVVVNDDTNLKRSIKNALIYPKYAIMDVDLTLTVNEYTTKYGLVDAFSHMMEEYFNNVNNSVIDRYIAGLMIEIIELAPKLLNDLENKELREKHMLLAYLAYNCDIRNMVGGDFACHGLDYGLASVFNTTHGAGLSVLMPNWMRYIADFKPAKIAKFGRDVFMLSEKDDHMCAIKASEALRNWLDTLNAAKTYNDLNVIINNEALTEMIEKSKVSYPLGNYHKLDESAIRSIYEMGL